jgi:hypothetical protein
MDFDGIAVAVWRFGTGNGDDDIGADWRVGRHYAARAVLVQPSAAEQERRLAGGSIVTQFYAL